MYRIRFPSQFSNTLHSCHAPSFQVSPFLRPHATRSDHAGKLFSASSLHLTNFAPKMLLIHIDGYLITQWLCLPACQGTRAGIHISFILFCSRSCPILNTMTYTTWWFVLICRLHRSLCPEPVISRTSITLPTILQRQFKQPHNLTFILFKNVYILFQIEMSLVQRLLITQIFG